MCEYKVENVYVEMVEMVSHCYRKYFSKFPFLIKLLRQTIQFIIRNKYPVLTFLFELPSKTMREKIFMN